MSDATQDAAKPTPLPPKIPCTGRTDIENATLASEEERERAARAIQEGYHSVFRKLPPPSPRANTVPTRPVGKFRRPYLLIGPSGVCEEFATPDEVVAAMRGCNPRRWRLYARVPLTYEGDLDMVRRELAAIESREERPVQWRHPSKGDLAAARARVVAVLEEASELLTFSAITFLLRYQIPDGRVRSILDELVKAKLVKRASFTMLRTNGTGQGCGERQATGYSLRR